MDFPTKLSALMRRRGIGNRGLAASLGISHPPVGEWRKGAARPRPEMAKRLADYFGVGVEVLLDDAQDLPVEYDAGRSEEERQERFVSAPLKAASTAADKLSGTVEERQAAFETYLKEVQNLRALAEAASPDDPAMALKLLEQLLAKWMTFAPIHTLNYDELLSEKLSATEIAAARKKLDELKARAAAAESQRPDEKGHRHAS